MKKKDLLLLSLCAISIAALPAMTALADRQTVGGSAATGTAFLLAKINGDLSDLDARDDQNQHINSISAAQKLEELFRQNLVVLTVFAQPHHLRQDFSLLESISDLFNKPILSRLWNAFELILDTIFAPERRFVHNVDNLCITFSVGAFACPLPFCFFALSRSPRKLNLRC